MIYYKKIMDDKQEDSSYTMVNGTCIYYRWIKIEKSKNNYNNDRDVITLGTFEYQYNRLHRFWLVW